MVLLALNELNHFLPQPRDRCCTKRPPCFRLKPEPTLFRNSWASYHTAEQRSSTVLDWWRALHYTHPFGEGGCKTDDKLKTYWQSNNWTELYLYVRLTRLAKVQSLLHDSGQKPRAVFSSHVFPRLANELWTVRMFLLLFGSDWVISLFYCDWSDAYL